jgi:hypothetical protein
MIAALDEIGIADRHSLIWHVAPIRELAASAIEAQRERTVVPLCSLPKFDPDPGAA